MTKLGGGAMIFHSDGPEPADGWPHWQSGLLEGHHVLASLAVPEALEALQRPVQADGVGDYATHVEPSGGHEADNVPKGAGPGVAERAAQATAADHESLGVYGGPVGAPSHQYHRRGRGQGPRGGVNHTLRSARLDPHVYAPTLRLFHDGLCHAALAERVRIVDGIGAHLFREAPADLDGFERHYPPRPGRPGEPDGGEPDRPSSYHGDPRARKEGGLDEHAHVGDARGFDQRSRLEAALLPERLEHLADGPAVLRFGDDVLGVCAVEGEAQLAEALAVVEKPGAARVALPAPCYLFGAHRVSGVEVHDILTHGLHDARELVSRDYRRGHHAGVDHVAFVVLLVHVHVRTAHAAGPDPNQYLVGPRGGLRKLDYVEARVPPHLVAVAREAPLLVPFLRRVTPPRLPVCLDHQRPHALPPPQLARFHMLVV